MTYKEGYTWELYNGIAIDGMYGPRLGIPLTENESGVILGLELEGRVRWSREGIQPYVGAHIGTAYFTERWESQGTDWGFTLGPTLGVQYGSWGIGYRFWHESNGTKVFGHSHGPNPGFNASMTEFSYSF